MRNNGETEGGEDGMDRDKLLPLALRVIGAIFIVGVLPLMMLWPSSAEPTGG